MRRWHDLLCSEDIDKKIVTPLSHPRTASNEEKVSAVADSVKADPKQISSKLALPLGTVHEIFHGNPYMRKLAAR